MHPRHPMAAIASAQQVEYQDFAAFPHDRTRNPRWGEDPTTTDSAAGNFRPCNKKTTPSGRYTRSDTEEVRGLGCVAGVGLRQDPQTRPTLRVVHPYPGASAGSGGKFL